MVNIKTGIPAYLYKLERERDEAQRVARQWYREAQRLKLQANEYNDKAWFWYREYTESNAWSAAWKRAAKRFRNLYYASRDYSDGQTDYEHSLESSLTNQRRRAEAAEKRIKELERALTDAEQTLRNISNELIGGDLPQIAHNAAQNIFFLLNKK